MTDNQRIFADEYIKSRNATQSYLIAYPKCKSENSAHASADRLLRNATISEYIERHLERKHISTIMDAAEIMEWLSANIRGEHDEDKTVKNSDKVNSAKILARMLGADSSIESARLKIEQERAKREAEQAASAKNVGIVEAILKAVDVIE